MNVRALFVAIKSSRFWASQLACCARMQSCPSLFECCQRDFFSTSKDGTQHLTAQLFKIVQNWTWHPAVSWHDSVGGSEPRVTVSQMVAWHQGQCSLTSYICIPFFARSTRSTQNIEDNHFPSNHCFRVLLLYFLTCFLYPSMLYFCSFNYFPYSFSFFGSTILNNTQLYSTTQNLLFSLYFAYSTHALRSVRLTNHDRAALVLYGSIPYSVCTERPMLNFDSAPYGIQCIEAHIFLQTVCHTEGFLQ